METNQHAIEVNGLSKVYGAKSVVNDVSFAVSRGEIFGLLGPNGAGKTTTLEILEGIRRPTAGTVRVCGFDVAVDAEKIKPLIGVKLQATYYYEVMKVDETIDIFRCYYGKTARSTESLLKEVGLTEQARAAVSKLSGGQRQRLALALALVNDPEVLFLDEPTTGLDPQARIRLWEIVLNLKREGKTIILTTHYMEEAERLCDRIAIIDQGSLLGCHSPQEWKQESLNVPATIKFHLNNGQPDDNDLSELSRIAPFERQNSSYVVKTAQPYQILHEILQFSTARKVKIRDLSLQEATLEDVFLQLTGRGLRE
ncbi:MAG: ABC transporter ATP-binding protein [Blastocatellia bacterium]